MKAAQPFRGAAVTSLDWASASASRRLRSRTSGSGASAAASPSSPARSGNARPDRPFDASTRPPYRRDRNWRPNQGAPMINEVNLAFVTVSDQDSAIEFWTQKCGFTVATDQAYGEGQRWVEVAPPQGTAHLALVPPMQEGQEPGGDAPVSFTTDDVEAAHSEMGEKGIERDDIMRM